jgi:hypothetical protein
MTRSMRLLPAVRCALFAGLVLCSPSIARAFSNLSGAYAFSGAATLNDPGKLCDGGASCGGVNNVAGSLNSFFQTLISDVKGGRCGGANPRLRTIASSMRGAKAQAGDRIYFTGSINADGLGHFSGGHMMANSSNLTAEVLNFQNTGASAVLCGGAAEDGDCFFLCTPASLNCDTLGGYNIGPAGTGTETIYAYPIAGSACGGRPTLTFAECCNDPTLVVVFHQAVTLGTHLRSILIDQGLTGSADAEAQ